MDAIPLRPAADANAQELAQRMCRAEIQAVLDKFGLQIGITRVERMTGGQVHISYDLALLPKSGPARA